MPVCVFFVSLGIVGIIMYLAGAGVLHHDVDEPPPDATAEPRPTPPWWVAVVVLVIAVAGLLLLSLVTAG